MNLLSFPTKYYRKLGLYICLILLAVFLPIILVQFNLNIVGFTLNSNHQVFELFGFFMSMFWIIVVYLEIQERKIKSFRMLVPVILICLTFFLFLSLIIEYSYSISGDYKVYEQGAQAIVDGVNLYNNPNAVRPYDYPPLLAQSLASIYYFYNQIFGPNYSGWTIVFYLWRLKEKIN